MFCGCDCFGWVDILFVIFSLDHDHNMEMAVHMATVADVFGSYRI